jgi:MscS family membrane protein
MKQIQILELELFGNPIREFLICIGILLFGVILKRLGAKFVSKQSFRMIKGLSKDQFSEIFVELLRKPIEQLLMLVILYLAFYRLTFPESWSLVSAEQIGVRWFIDTVYHIALLVVVTKILLRTTDYLTFVFSNREGATVSIELANFLKELIKVVIVILCIFAGLRFIFSVNITALIASLGIGGLAVALAAQDTLGNLLASFIIYLDRPFKIGDTIETADIKGIVEHVGFRTTRVRTNDKSLLTVPNKKMIDTALNNITLSEIRRVKIVLTLTYGTRAEQILAIIEDIRKAIVAHPETTDNTVVNFADLEPSSLNILVIYFVKGNEYEHMLKVKEELNIQIMQIVEKNGSGFAFPSQTVYLQKGE